MLAALSDPLTNAKKTGYFPLRTGCHCIKHLSFPIRAENTKLSAALLPPPSLPPKPFVQVRENPRSKRRRPGPFPSGLRPAKVRASRAPRARETTETRPKVCGSSGRFRVRHQPTRPFLDRLGARARAGWPPPAPRRAHGPGPAAPALPVGARRRDLPAGDSSPSSRLGGGGGGCAGAGCRRGGCARGRRRPEGASHPAAPPPSLLPRRPPRSRGPRTTRRAQLSSRARPALLPALPLAAASALRPGPVPALGILSQAPRAGRGAPSPRDSPSNQTEKRNEPSHGKARGH